MSGTPVAVNFLTGDPFTLPVPDDHPAAAAAFDAIWAGEATGFGEAYTRKELASYHRMRDDLTNHRIRPSTVIGTGYKRHRVRPLAFEWIDRRIAECKADLASRGRTNSVNRSNVRGVLRRAGITQESPCSP